MEVVSFHFLKPYMASLLDISIGMGAVLLTLSGIANDVKNSRRVASSPCHARGIKPDKISEAAYDRLLHDN